MVQAPNGSGMVPLKNGDLRELMVAQLRHDGYMHLANVVSNELGMRNVAPSPRLDYLTRLGIKAQQEGLEISEEALLNEAEPVTLKGEVSEDNDRGLDLDDSVGTVDARPAPLWDSFFLAAHKSPCSCMQYSPSGRWLVSGSEDQSIKIMSTEIINSKPTDHDNVLRPVTQTLVGAHADRVNDITFHPDQDFMVSGGEDCMIRFYNLNRRRGQVRHNKELVEKAPVRTLSHHPLGNHLLCGTSQPVIRLYDVNTHQCFAPSNAKDHHSSAINMVRYFPQSNAYVSCSEDGAFKIWDSVSSKCVNTFTGAHRGSPVSSVFLSKNEHYILTSGLGGMAKLWDLRFGRGELVQYEGITTMEKTPAILVHNEEYVVACHGQAPASPLGVWDARTGKLLVTMKGHNKPIRAFAVSPYMEGFMTAAGDSRIRHFRSPVS